VVNEKDLEPKNIKPKKIEPKKVVFIINFQFVK
jgi:hypothetical protein